MRRVLLLSAVWLSACPQLMMADAGAPDAGMAAVDAGEDAGDASDAGRPRFDAGTPDAGFSVTSLATWCRDRALATCLRHVRCGALSEAAVADCVARTTPDCDQTTFNLGVDAGRLAFDASVALDCLNGFGGGSCAVDPPACASVFTGLVPPDGGCVTATDCRPGAYCANVFVCPSRCTVFRGAGERCSFQERCEAGLACFPADGGPEVCQRPTAAGRPCTDFDECGDEALCLSGTCVGRQADAGARCAVQSGFPFCPTEFFCRQAPPPNENEPAPPGTCQRRVGLGGTCTGRGSCLPSLRCSTVVTTGTCVVRARRGETCADFEDCEQGLFCSNMSQRCETFPGDGGDCSFMTGSNGRCQPGLFCNFGSTSADRRCERRRAPGEPCSYDSMCLSNECEFGALPDGGFGSLCAVLCSLKADAGL